MEKTAMIKAYDYDSADQAFDVLFCTGRDRSDGIIEIPAASYQLLVSALECLRWETSGSDNKIINQAIGIAERLRDQQKRREWERG